MYIYQIENIINRKKYIGSTKNIEKRKQQHINASNSPTSKTYNYPLQRAIRKYGKENFIFSQLEECDDISVAEREKYYITLLNSLTNSGWGYNQTDFTYCALQDPKVIQANIKNTGVPCALVDDNNNIIRVFNSYHQASKEMFGINEGSKIRVVCNGEQHSIHNKIFRRLDENKQVIIPVAQTRKRKTAIYSIDVNDNTKIQYYDSVSEASRKENIPRTSISKCINGSTKYSKVHNRIWRKVGDE